MVLLRAVCVNKGTVVYGYRVAFGYGIEDSNPCPAPLYAPKLETLRVQLAQPVLDLIQLTQ